MEHKPKNETPKSLTFEAFQSLPKDRLKKEFESFINQHTRESINFRSGSGKRKFVKSLLEIPLYLNLGLFLKPDFIGMAGREASMNDAESEEAFGLLERMGLITPETDNEFIQAYFQQPLVSKAYKFKDPRFLDVLNDLSKQYVESDFPQSVVDTINRTSKGHGGVRSILVKIYRKHGEAVLEKVANKLGAGKRGWLNYYELYKADLTHLVNRAIIEAAEDEEKRKVIESRRKEDLRIKAEDLRQDIPEIQKIGRAVFRSIIPDARISVGHPFLASGTFVDAQRRSATILMTEEILFLIQRKLPSLAENPDFYYFKLAVREGDPTALIELQQKFVENKVKICTLSIHGIQISPDVQKELEKVFPIVEISKY